MFSIFRKYQICADRALASAKLANKKAQEKEATIRRTADIACEKFEAELKDKVAVREMKDCYFEQSVIDGYRFLADQAQMKAEQETRFLKDQW